MTADDQRTNMAAGDPWVSEMQARGLIDENGWFVHRLWKVAPVSIRTSHSEPLPKPEIPMSANARLRADLDTARATLRRVTELADELACEWSCQDAIRAALDGGNDE